MHGKKFFAVRFFLGARQTLEFAVRFFIAHGKLFFFPTSVTPVSTKGRAVSTEGGQFFSPFAVRLKKRMAKRILCRAFLFWHTTKYFRLLSPKFNCS
jgi:hypothetical protein